MSRPPSTPALTVVAGLSTVSLCARASILEVESRALAVLDAPAGPEEPIERAFRRKEDELRALFGQLSAGEALALFRRLTLVCPTDILASRFARLVTDRRARLLAFLAAAPRREAIARARRP
jgi:hypothetical protein